MSLTRVCLQCQGNFIVRDQDLHFYRSISLQISGQVVAIPPPVLCPECRLIRRLASRNETALYARTSSLSGKDIIAMYSPEAPYPVAEVSELGIDKFDASDYGLTYDHSPSFWAQFDTLARTVPHQALLNFGGQEGLSYNNFTYEQKNCYLCFWGDYGQDSLYNYGFVNLKNCVDTFWLFDGELCFGCVNSQYCYRSHYVLTSEHISDSAFIMDCKWLDHCLFCVNLQHKKYCIFNQQYSPEEYFAKKKELQTGSFLALEKMKQEFYVFAKTFPKRALRNTAVENCELGDCNNNAKDCYQSLHMVESEGCCYGIDNMKVFNCYDCYGSVNIQYCYDCYAAVNCQKAYWSYDIYDSSNIFYCQSCRNCQDCFGCIGLRGKQYCILNKQYTKEHYEELLPQIIAHMKAAAEFGEFFPVAISPFGYNESTAFEYFPQTRTWAESHGYHWSDYIAPKPKVDRFIAAKDLPDNINDVQDSILDHAVLCALTERPFRIVKPELAFYREYQIPLPRIHPDERRRALVRLKNPRKLREATCAKCHQCTWTSFPEGSDLIIYCESCYQTEFSS